VASSPGQRQKPSSQWSATASRRSTSTRMLVARAIAPEAKHLGMIGPAEGVQLLAVGLGEVDERAMGFTRRGGCLLE